jgi:hypothetical protein
MTGSLIFVASDRHAPTLWPLDSNDRTPTEFILEDSIKENKLLKKMVVNLSDIILEFVVSKK